MSDVRKKSQHNLHVAASIVPAECREYTPGLKCAGQHSHSGYCDVIPPHLQSYSGCTLPSTGQDVKSILKPEVADSNRTHCSAR